MSTAGMAPARFGGHSFTLPTDWNDSCHKHAAPTLKTFEIGPSNWLGRVQSWDQFGSRASLSGSW